MLEVIQVMALVKVDLLNCHRAEITLVHLEVALVVEDQAVLIALIIQLVGLVMDLEIVVLALEEDQAEAVVILIGQNGLDLLL
jgi:hypothetical protein